MSDTSSNISTLASTIKQGITSQLKDLHTSLPGIIQSFDAATQLATVQPAIKRVFVTREGDGDTEFLTPSNLPILINVPVVFPRGGGFSLTMPVKPGDECLVVFCERSIDNWHETGKIRVPGARRFHSLSDATAFVGLSSIPNKIPNYDPNNMEIKKDDGSVSIKLLDNGDLEIVSQGNITATITGDATLTCTNLDVTASATATVTCPESTFIGNVTVNGNITSTGIISSPTVAAGSSLTVAAKEMNGHTHSQSNDSGGNTEQNTGPPV